MSNPLKNFAAATALATTLAAPAAAAPVYYDFTVTGTINSSSNILTGDPGTVIPTYAPYGSQLTMVYRFDLNAADTNPSANIGNFGAPQLSSLTMDGLSLSRDNTGLQPGRITQEISNNKNYFAILSGSYRTNTPTGVGSINASFSAEDGIDFGSIFDDANDLSNIMNGLINADSMNVAINFTGNGQGGVPFFIEEAQFRPTSYSFNKVAIDPPVGQVPEPSSLALIGAGLAGAYVASRRRRETEAAPAVSTPTLAA